MAFCSGVLESKGCVLFSPQNKPPGFCWQSGKIQSPLPELGRGSGPLTTPQTLNQFVRFLVLPSHSLTEVPGVAHLTYKSGHVLLFFTSGLNFLWSVKAFIKCPSVFPFNYCVIVVMSCQFSLTLRIYALKTNKQKRNALLA